MKLATCLQFLIARQMISHRWIHDVVATAAVASYTNVYVEYDGVCQQYGAMSIIAHHRHDGLRRPCHYCPQSIKPRRMRSRSSQLTSSSRRGRPQRIFNVYCCSIAMNDCAAFVDNCDTDNSK